MKTLFLSILLCFGFSLSQSQDSKPCTSPEASEFDFWVGEWDAYWNDSLRGTNRIEKMYGNCTIHENFSDPGSVFLGQSWSVYSPSSKQWQQTWVDNQGGYIVLTGGMVGDTMILTTEEQTVPEKVSPTGKILRRMTFYHITKNSFDWNWQSSTDGRQTWKILWKRHYTRRK